MYKRCRERSLFFSLIFVLHCYLQITTKKSDVCQIFYFLLVLLMVSLSAIISTIWANLPFIVVGLIIFMWLVIIHEFGHFWACRWTKVKVLEFGLGIPPKIMSLGKDKHGTEFTLNAIPLWWFVTPKGENGKDAGTYADHDSFMKASVASKLIILVAGVVMNLITARLLFVLCFVIWVKPLSLLPDNMTSVSVRSYLMPTYDVAVSEWLISGDVTQAAATIEQVLSGGLASTMGLRSWDVVRSINNQAVHNLIMQRVLKQNIWKPIVIYYQRDGVFMSWSAICPQDSCMLWVLLSQSWALELLPIRMWWVQAMVASVREIQAQTILTLNALWSLGSSFLSLQPSQIGTAVDKMSGPVGAIWYMSILVDRGWWIALLAFAGMISLALAIFNILPIPALDGGRMLGVIIQSVFRLPLKSYFTIENYINLIFFVLLMWLGLYIMFKDLVVVRWVSLR